MREFRNYDIGPFADALARHDSKECRTAALQVSAAAHYNGLAAPARLALELPGDPREQQAALDYLIAIYPDSPIDADWIRSAASHAAACGAPWPPTPSAFTPRIRQAFFANSWTITMLPSPAPRAVRPAASATDLFEQLIQRLADHAVRGAAVESLAQFGSRVSGTLADVLADPNALSAIRRQIPRVLRLIRDTRSVDVLVANLGVPDIALRTAVIKALNRLRSSAPELAIPAAPVREEIRNEVLRCFGLHAQAAPLRVAVSPRTAGGLLVRTLDDYFQKSMERLFRLLGLLYPPEEVYNCWLARHSGNSERLAAAHDYLDSILDREMKRLVMPLLDSPDRLASHGRDLFRIESKSAETALRELLAGGDAWLPVFAVAAAGEMKLSGLGAEIARVRDGSGRDIVEVARAAAVALG